MGLADAEPAVEVDPGAARGGAAAAEQAAARWRPGEPPGELLQRLHRRGLGRLGRVGAVGVEPHLGEPRRRHERGDQRSGGTSGARSTQPPRPVTGGGRGCRLVHRRRLGEDAGRAAAARPDP